MKKILFILLLCISGFSFVIDTEDYHQIGITWAQGMQDSITFQIDTTIDLDSASAVFTIWVSYDDTTTIFTDSLDIYTHTISLWFPDSITDTLIGIFPADVWLETKDGKKRQIYYKYLNIHNSSRGR